MFDLNNYSMNYLSNAAVIEQVMTMMMMMFGDADQL